MSHPDASPAKIGWLDALNPRYLADPSTLFLIAANLLPLFGVLFWGWDLYSLLVLYWMETGIIGVFAIVRMAMAAGAFALFLVPFFIVHFGGFMAGHIFFLTVMFGGGGAGKLEQLPGLVWSVLVQRGLWVALVALFISHGVSFVRNVLRRRRRQPGQHWLLPSDLKQAQSYMLAPYGRIIVMHVTIIFGAMLVQVFQTKAAAFVLLIALKIVFDVAAHVRKNFAPVTLTTQ